MPKETLQLNPQIPEFSKVQKNPVFWFAYDAFRTLKAASGILGEQAQTDNETFERICLTREEVRKFIDIMTNHPDVYKNRSIRSEVQHAQKEKQIGFCFVEYGYDHERQTHTIDVSISMGPDKVYPFFVASVTMAPDLGTFGIRTPLVSSRGRQPGYSTDAAFIHAIGAIAEMRRNDANALIRMTPGN